MGRVGEHCQEDDSLAIALCEEAERRHRSGAGRGAEAAGPLSLAGDGDHEEEEEEEEEDEEEEEESRHPRQRRRRRRYASSLLSPPRPISASPSPLIEGLKQRLLAHMYLQAGIATNLAAFGPNMQGPGPLDAFRYYFESYQELLMSKARTCMRILFGFISFFLSFLG
jgi:hypothetical protein